MNNYYVGKKNYADGNNLPIFAMVAANVSDTDVSHMTLAAEEYANFIAERVKHIFQNNIHNDCISSALVCQISKLVTPEHSLSANNIHSYKMRGVDLTSIISSKLSVSVCKSVKCKVDSNNGILSLISTSESADYVERQINFFVDNQISFKNRQELVLSFCSNNSVPIKAIPTLSVINHLVKYGLKLTIPLSIKYPAKLPEVWKCINQKQPKTMSELSSCMISLSKSSLITSTFPSLVSKSIHFYPELPENKAVPPLFYIRTGKGINDSKLGFQVSMTTSRPFINGSSEVVVFRLKNERGNSAFLFEEKVKSALIQQGIAPIEKKSDHYNLSFNDLVIQVIKVVCLNAELLNFVTSFHFTESLAIYPLTRHSKLQAPDKQKHQKLENPVNEIANNQTIEKSTFDWLLRVLTHHAASFGYNIRINKI
ncbi:hypothetical protein GMES_1959 [Paraglaciecola mesophila KMM 241]|uniref:Uncharacterized protein n=2 Tax=Paraglaciecola mesophila TaxID=197222 RepID=K6ZLL6_9ALTE|nr:hypothetical protein GMES_1959 [Paraglaciecola mesophila KMM 241]